MAMAVHAATRSTCDRKHVGCVLVRDNVQIGMGYNGSLRRLAHCDDDGHAMVEGHCVRTVHAETNAVAHAARNGVRIEGATAYVTAMPCWGCFRILVQAGICRIVYGEPYRPDPMVADAAELLGIPLDYIEAVITQVTPAPAAAPVRRTAPAVPEVHAHDPRVVMLALVAAAIVAVVLHILMRGG
jgi:dCMP deaminase